MPSKLESDDTVVVSRRLGTPRVGLVIETYQEQIDELDDEEEQSKSSLKPGQCRVEWFPSGKEGLIEENKTSLLDRSLLIGEPVCRRSDPHFIGYIQNMHLCADALILPEKQWVVRCITEKNIQFTKVYDDTATSCPVIFKNWVGNLNSVGERLLLRNNDGLKCWLRPSDPNRSEDVIDCTWKKREQYCSFDHTQWYVRQVVKVPMLMLQQAEWVDCEPSDRLKRRIAQGSAKHMRMLVEKVELESLGVHWVAPIQLGPDDMTDPPEPLLKGEDLPLVRKLDQFEYQLAQVGDRIDITATQEVLDSMITYADWKKQLSKEFQQTSLSGKGKAPAVLKTANQIITPWLATAALATLSTSSSNEYESAHSEAELRRASFQESTDDLYHTASESTSLKSLGDRADQGPGTASSGASSASISSGSTASTPSDSEESGATDLLGRVRRRLGYLARRRNRFSRRGPRPRAKATMGKARKAEILRTCVPASSQQRPILGDVITSEIIFGRSYLDVLWQDGHMEKNVLSSELAFAALDLDDHIFFPGNFVLMQKTGDGGEHTHWPEQGYGSVVSVNAVERIAEVNWYEFGTAVFAPQFLRCEQVSVYEIVIHPDYSYFPSMQVMRVENPVIGKACVGPIIRMNPEKGCLMVQWVGSAEPEAVFPTEVVPVHRDDDDWNGEGEDQSEYGSGDDASSGDGSSGWETESEATDDADEEPRPCLITKEDLRTKLGTVKDVVEQLQALLQRIQKTPSLSDDDQVSMRGDLVVMTMKTIRMLRHLVREGFGKSLKSFYIYQEIGPMLKMIKKWARKVRVQDKHSRRLVEEPPFQAYAKPDGEEEGDGEGAPISQSESTQSLDDFSLLQLEQEQSDLEAQMKQCNSMLPPSTFAQDPSVNAATATAVPAMLDDVMLQRAKNFVEWMSEHLPLDTVATLDKQAFLTALEQNPTARGALATFATVFEQTIADVKVLSTGNTLPSSAINPTSAGSRAAVDINCMAIHLFCLDIVQRLTEFLDADVWRGGATRRFSWPGPQDDIGANRKFISFKLGLSEDGSVSFATTQPAQQKTIAADTTEANDEEPPQLIDTSEQHGVSPELPESSPTKATTRPIAKSGMGFEVLDNAPASHHYISDEFNAGKLPRHFTRAVMEELKILGNSLPEGLYVKAYEDRMDLFSAMIVGPKATPFTQGLFVFDVKLPADYPNEPPLVFYRSFSPEQLNPNLYQDGKVCVSLLGTWSGRESEMWNPGSNLLQVFVSIQGLILNAEPYFNEAGYEVRRSLAESVEKSRRYNEMAVLRNIESLTKIVQSPPEPFAAEMNQHALAVGEKIVEDVLAWCAGQKECGFPLLPVSQGFVLSAKRVLSLFQKALSSLEK